MSNPWRFASGLSDDQTGLLKFGTRYHDPSIGRWTQTDAKTGNVRDPFSLNRYLYVADDPINGIDPTGQSWWNPLVDWSWTDIFKGALYGLGWYAEAATIGLTIGFG